MMAADLTVYDTVLKNAWGEWIEYDFFHRDGESMLEFRARRRAERRQRRVHQWALTGVARQEYAG